MRSNVTGTAHRPKILPVLGADLSGPPFPTAHAWSCADRIGQNTHSEPIQSSVIQRSCVMAMGLCRAATQARMVGPGTNHKAKRTHWDDEIVESAAVGATCSQGLWVECALCADKAGQPARIASDNPFGLKKWRRHEASMVHLRHLGELEGDVSTNTVASLLELSAGGMQCPGIYNGEAKHLRLMMQFGDIKDDRIAIVVDDELAGAFSLECTKAAHARRFPRKKSTKHQLKGACAACFTLAGDVCDSFCKRVDKMVRVELVLDAMLSGETNAAARKAIIDFTKSNQKANPNWNHLLAKTKAYKQSLSRRDSLVRS
ncbi:hypothetical protein SPRG_03454 [Saprolegnia parasitica CBS 223.65]|uniref:Uncharacterized protein n=1 Tax=Saprolegnia parasitica (strain CBS 223.65) TaxID=695850 RepID=A0A067CYA8_SAPPC|nr:hypothetical protein SPRG_03454 [Saprolegnia parasitica CBS 223.65]KDO31526.1 hypothetical protein SPRG_03454 [Saprolegnia parasitica CBS 223.65]|eukprot:XP_012197436.1 hypothetical protein SPRG_03454 [Saprolegnia parasitica CBS 223.65]